MSDHEHEPITEVHYKVMEYVQALIEIALLPDDQIHTARDRAMQALKWSVVPENFRRGTPTE